MEGEKGAERQSERRPEARQTSSYRHHRFAKDGCREIDEWADPDTHAGMAGTTDRGLDSGQPTTLAKWNSRKPVNGK